MDPEARFRALRSSGDSVLFMYSSEENLVISVDMHVAFQRLTAASQSANTPQSLPAASAHSRPHACLSVIESDAHSADPPGKLQHALPSPDLPSRHV